MDAVELYHFLFETYEGIGVMVLVGLVVSAILCVIFERRTRKKFQDRPKSEGSWSLFEDEDEKESKDK